MFGNTELDVLRDGLKLAFRGVCARFGGFDAGIDAAAGIQRHAELGAGAHEVITVEDWPGRHPVAK